MVKIVLPQKLTQKDFDKYLPYLKKLQPNAWKRLKYSEEGIGLIFFAIFNDMGRAVPPILHTKVLWRAAAGAFLCPKPLLFQVSNYLTYNFNIQSWTERSQGRAPTSICTAYQYHL